MASPYGGGDRGVPVRRDTSGIWKRALFMLVIMVCLGIAHSVLYTAAVVQFVWMLITGERNGLIAQFGRSLGLWLAESARFLTGDTEDKPFPWKPWPSS